MECQGVVLDSECTFFTSYSGLNLLLYYIMQVPTFTPDERGRALNMFASAIGDDRAAAVRRKYGRPLKAVVIMSAGLVE
jgi:hypothetical protein